MQYSPKLKKVMEEIKAIVKKHDIGAMVVLHSPGYSEYLNHLATSYSCAFIEGDKLRIRARLQEDFKGDREAWQKKITDTINMLQHFTDVSGPMLLAFFDLIDLIKKKVEIENDPGESSSHTQQNN